MDSSRPSVFQRLRNLPMTWIVAACVLLVLIVAVFALRRPLADALWPETKIQQLLQQAGVALQQGKLGDARALYEAAQALDDDRSEARAGLASVAQTALRQGNAALARNHLDEVRNDLQLARDLQAPREGVDALAGGLRQREIASAGLPDLLQKAQAAQQAGHLDDGDAAALPLYARILAVQPDHTAALEGREDALTDLLQQARDDLQRGQLEAGAHLVERARGYDAGHVDLPDSQAALARALDRRLRQADAQLGRGQWQAALDGHQAVFAISADPRQREAAQAGIDQAVAGLTAQVRRLAADYRFDAAQALLDTAQRAAPQSGDVRAAREYLARVRNERGHANAPKLTAAQRKQKLRVLLDGLDAAAKRGNWLTPPGDSAYDKLRAAQAIAADDAQVQRADKRLHAQMQSCFESELAANRLHGARTCFDAWTTLAPRDAALGAARKRLAARWVAVGSDQLALGNLTVANEAATQARELDAGAPGLDAFARRVRDASAVVKP